MAAGVTERFQKLERDRMALLARIEGLTAEELCRRPGEDEWSVSHVIGHLILAEELSLGYIHKKIQAPDKLVRPGLRERMKSRLLTVVLRSPLRFKSPKAAADPVPESDPARIRSHWDAVRDDLHGLIDDLPSELAERAVYRHPLAGPMSLARCMAFLDEHVAHHRRQIDRILARLSA